MESVFDILSVTALPFPKPHYPLPVLVADGGHMLAAVRVDHRHDRLAPRPRSPMHCKAFEADTARKRSRQLSSLKKVGIYHAEEFPLVKQSPPPM